MTEPTSPDDDRAAPLVLLRPEPGEEHDAFQRRAVDAFVSAGMLPPPEE